MMEKVLIVDDEAANLQVLREILKSDYQLHFAKRGLDAISIAQKCLPDIILLDIMMPDMDGYEVCRRLKEREETAEIPIIIVSALNKEMDEVEGFKLGANDYITKPVRPAIVKARIKTLLALRNAQLELQNQNEILEQKVQERTVQLVKTQKEIVIRLGWAAEYRDPETGDHINRMSHYSAAIGRAYGLGHKECIMLLDASPMHDIGKVGTPDHILLKPGKLDNEEWNIMKQHPTIGAQILADSDSELLQAASEIARTHHEKWNGKGYPDGISGEDIPLFGRISAIADVFDALTSKRPYKDPWPVEKAVNLIVEEKAQHFDPTVVDAMMKILPEILEIKDRFPN